MIAKIVAIVCAGIFSGAAIYINAVEHPARLECGTELAIRQWRPSYRRATVMQASLAIIGFIAAVVVWIGTRDLWFLVAATLLGSVVPITLVVILPTNKQLMQPGIESSLERANQLLHRWGKLHLLRSVASACSFLIMLIRSVS